MRFWGQEAIHADERLVYTARYGGGLVDRRSGDGMPGRRMTHNPLAQDPVTDPEDRALVLRAKSGDAAALEELGVRHQQWIYKFAVRMLYHPQDAEDATQEILVKALTALSSYEERSSFRTWLYRIAVNHVLNTKRGRLEPPTISFSCYAHGLDRTPDLD